MFSEQSAPGSRGGNLLQTTPIRRVTGFRLQTPTHLQWSNENANLGKIDQVIWRTIGPWRICTWLWFPKERASILLASKMSILIIQTTSHGMFYENWGRSRTMVRNWGFHFGKWKRSRTWRQFWWRRFLSGWIQLPWKQNLAESPWVGILLHLTF